MTNFESISTASESIDLSENLDLDTISRLKNQPGIERSSQVGFDPEQLISKPTYLEVGIEKITALCDALGMTAKTAQVIEVFRVMTASWGERKIGSNSDWLCDVSDDGSPFEFSIALDPQQAELRILIEAQGSDPNLQSNWQAGLDLNQHLAANFNISLDRFGQIEDLFVPTNPAAKFSMWHAVCFYPDKEPAFKLYLNPQSQVKSRAAAVVEESLVRLGFPHAWSNLAEIAAQRGPDKDEFTYFSLDLAANSKARVKIYLRHYDATTDDLEKALSCAGNYVPGDVTEFCQALTLEQGSFTSKPMASCFSFIEGNDARPSSGTLYIPIGYYTSNDRVVADRIEQYFSQHHLPTSAYTESLQAFATRSLESRNGMHSHISLRQENQQRRVTFYLNPEVTTVRSSDLKTTAKATWKPRLSIEETALHYDTTSIVDHPFLQRLHRDPVNMTHLWLLLANGREAVVAPFTRRLAIAVDRVKDEHIRDILTKQLNEELGNGDPTQIHLVLFDRLFHSLEIHKPAAVTEQMLAPGHELSQRLDALFVDPNPYVCVGSAIVMEILGKQLDQFMEQEFLTRTTVDSHSLTWLNLHAEIEIEHANESIELARLIADSDGDEEATRQGAEITADGTWKFCDGMYRVCYGTAATV
jgi:DMATS type aromatic prenyltransferase